MRIPILSGILAAFREWNRRGKLKEYLDREFRNLVFENAYGEMCGNYDDEVLLLRKKYEAAGLTEKETQTVIARILFVRIEG